MYQSYNDDEKKKLNQFSQVIKEYVENGMELLTYRINANEILKKDLASYLLFRQILEMGDAIGELIGIGCINASKPLVRSLLEYYFQYSYLLKDNEERKALQFLYKYEMFQLEYFLKLAYPERDGSFFKKQQKDKHLKNIDISDEQKKICINNISNIRKTISSEDYREISIEYKRTEIKKSSRFGKKGKVDKWYELFDGPGSIEGIAVSLEETSLYEQIYRDLSSYIHGLNIVHSNLKSVNENSFGISDLRDVRQMWVIANNSIILIEKSCILFLQHKIDDPKKFADRFLPLAKKAQEFRK